jgi:hypothetical protein
MMMDDGCHNYNQYILMSFISKLLSFIASQKTRMYHNSFRSAVPECRAPGSIWRTVPGVATPTPRNSRLPSCFCDNSQKIAKCIKMHIHLYFTCYLIWVYSVIFYAPLVTPEPVSNPHLSTLTREPSLASIDCGYNRPGD